MAAAAQLSGGRITLRLYFVVLVVLVAFSGCYRGPARSQVSGKVLLKDGTVPKGGVRVVRFEPSENSTAEIRKGASGAIAPDGTFVMNTRKPGDGVYNGEYAVTFAVLKSPTDPVSLILPKYTSAKTSPYKITVDGDKQDLQYEIEPLPGT